MKGSKAPSNTALTLPVSDVRPQIFDALVRVQDVRPDLTSKVDI